MDETLSSRARAPAVAGAALPPPSSERLSTLCTELLQVQKRNEGKLPLNQATLTGTAAAALPGLLARQFGFNAFTMASAVQLEDVYANTLRISGEGSQNDVGLTLTLLFTDNLGEIDIQALFSTPTYGDLQLAFPTLPAGFFKDVSTPGSNPSVTLPADMPAAVGFSQASYGVMAYWYPGRGFPLSYIAPQIEGTVTTRDNRQRKLHLELPTAMSGWRALSPEARSWTFDDLLWLLPQAEIGGNFPSIIPSEHVAIQFFQLYLTPAAPKFSALYLMVDNKPSPGAPLWSACQDKVQLRFVSVAMNLTLDANSVKCDGSGWIRGGFTLGDAVLFASIPYPLNAGAWSIDSYPRLTLSKGLDDVASLLQDGASFTANLPGGLNTVLEAFELSRLYVAVDPLNMALQRLTFKVSTTRKWPLVPGVLELDKLSVQFNVDGSGATTGAVQCQFALGKHGVVFVSFQRYEPKGDWYFVVNSPVIALPSLGDLAQLANGADLSSRLQAAGLGKLAFLMTDLNIGVTLGTQTKLTNLGFNLTLSDSADPEQPSLDWEVIPGVLTLHDFSVGMQLNWKTELEANITGYFRLNSLDFAVKFGNDGQGDAFVGAYSPDAAAGSHSVDIASLVRSISPRIADLVPAGLIVALDDIFLAYINVGTRGKKFIFAIDISVEIPLTGIPLIGNALPRDAKVEIQDLKIAVCSDELYADEVTAVNNLLASLPAGMAVKPLAMPPQDQAGALIPRGFSMAAKLTMGSLSLLVSAPAVTPSPSPARRLATLPGTRVPGRAMQDNPAAAYQNTMWIDVQKTFGPVNLEKVGFNYHDGKAYVMLNAGLAVGPLAFELLGLGVGTPLSKPELTFDIEGIAVSYSFGPLTIAGGMIGTLQPHVDFAGALVIEAEAFNLSAFGGYASLEGQPSFFLYALMNEPPLGGPPAFFVTGLAAGLGFNRSLVIPGIADVYRFPFVAWAVAPGGAPALDPSQPIGEQVTKTINLLSSQGVVAPKLGEYWLAGGLQFTTYEILSSFALVTVSFGTDFEVDLLGMSTLSMPPAVQEPIAEVQLEIKVSFAPSAGLFSLAGQLTPNSYVFSRSCQLTGGFAFYYWFAKDHAGDFLVSLGGYNSKFTVPQWYPSVPRLGMNWRLSDTLSVTGELYFALTNNVVMAGGKLSAVWESGPVRAWFMLWADFLMVFKPLHYYIGAGIDLGASFTIKLLFIRISITIHLGVAVECWGPEFSGKATVDLSIISFTIHFGAKQLPQPTKLEWGDFVGQLLPSSPAAAPALLLADAAAPAAAATAPALVHIVIKQGLVKQLDKDAAHPVFLVNGETFSCTVQTVIPTKVTKLTGVVDMAPDKLQPHDKEGKLVVANTQFGAGPSQIAPEKFQPTLTIDIRSSEESRFVAVRSFAVAPKALWEVKQFDANGVPQTNPATDLTAANVTDTLKGYDLLPTVADPDYTLPIPKHALEVTTEGQPQRFAWSKASFATSDSFSKETVAGTISTAPVPAVRDAWFAAMLEQMLEIDTHADVANLATPGNNDLLAEPLLRLLGEQRSAQPA
jgi:hypothetical protein